MNIKKRNLFLIGTINVLVILTTQTGFTQNRALIQTYSHEYGDSRQMWLFGDDAKNIFDILSQGSPRTANPRDVSLISQYTGVNIQCEQGFNALKKIAYSCFTRLFWSAPSGSEAPLSGEPTDTYHGQFTTKLVSSETVEVKLLGNASYHVVGIRCQAPRSRNECTFAVDIKGNIKF